MKTVFPAAAVVLWDELGRAPCSMPGADVGGSGGGPGARAGPDPSGALGGGESAARGRPARRSSQISRKTAAASREHSTRAAPAALNQMAQSFNLSNVLRAIYGAGAAKRIARCHDVSLATAKNWLSGRSSPARLDQVVCRLNAEVARRRAELDEIQGWINGVVEGKRWLGSGSPPPGELPRRHGDWSGLAPPLSGSARAV